MTLYYLYFIPVSIGFFHVINYISYKNLLFVLAITGFSPVSTETATTILD
jgi:hypothetical protein